MFETPTNPRTQAAINRAHEERAQAVRNAWLWVTGRK